MVSPRAMMEVWSFGAEGGEGLLVGLTVDGGFEAGVAAEFGEAVAEVGVEGVVTGLQIGELIGQGGEAGVRRSG